MADLHDTHLKLLRDWLTGIMIQHDVTASEIARKALLSESTLTRFMNPKGPGNVLREASIAKIERAYRTTRPSTLRGMSDRKTTTPDFTIPGQKPGAPSAMSASEQLETIMNKDYETLEAFVVADRALDLSGYLPDDIILVDLNRAPEAGDVVALRFYTGPSRAPIITLRIFDTPFLTAHSTDETMRRPILQDPDRIEILGVVTTAMRHRDTQ